MNRFEFNATWLIGFVDLVRWLHNINHQAIFILNPIFLSGRLRFLWLFWLGVKKRCEHLFWPEICVNRLVAGLKIAFNIHFEFKPRQLLLSPIKWTFRWIRLLHRIIARSFVNLTLLIEYIMLRNIMDIILEVECKCLFLCIYSLLSYFFIHNSSHCLLRWSMDRIFVLKATLFRDV